MVTDIVANSATLAGYDRDADRFVSQYCSEEEPDACDIDCEVGVILAIRWFLTGHGRAGKRIVKRRKPRKSVRNDELRRLIQYFTTMADAFSLWIAGCFLIASRIGWRPGEIILMHRQGNFLRAPAEKNTNGRGLSDTCEVDISAYPSWLIVRIDKWIDNIVRWEGRYGGLWNLRSAMNSRLATACGALHSSFFNLCTVACSATRLRSPPPERSR